jgi:hypothetical protein
MELCLEGEPPTCCWILEEGSVMAVNMKVRDLRGSWIHFSVSDS